MFMSMATTSVLLGWLVMVAVEGEGIISLVFIVCNRNCKYFRILGLQVCSSSPVLDFILFLYGDVKLLPENIYCIYI